MLILRSKSHLSRSISNSFLCIPRKCQVVRVLWRSSKNMFLTATLDNYMYMHSAWVDTAFVLSSEHVTLQGVNKTHAFFCVTQPSVDVYSSNFYPFVFTNQFMLAEKLIIVSLDEFHHMAGRFFYHMYTWSAEHYLSMHISRCVG